MMTHPATVVGFDGRNPRPGVDFAPLIERLALGEQRDELLDSARARLRTLGVLDAVQEGVPARALERREELLRAGGGLECLREIRRNGGARLWLVGGVPASVGLGELNLLESRGLHQTACDELGSTL